MNYLNLLTVERSVYNNIQCLLNKKYHKSEEYVKRRLEGGIVPHKDDVQYEQESSNQKHKVILDFDESSF